MRALRPASALIVAVALVLTGCSALGIGGGDRPATANPSTPSGQDTGTPTTPGAGPATGTLITGTGYSFRVPEGWAEADASLAPGADVLVMNTRSSAQFTDSINVLLSPAGLVPLALLEQATRGELEGIGARDVMVGDRVRTGGNEFTHISAFMTLNTLNYQVEQFAVNSNSQTYLITFAFSPSVTEQERMEVATSTLATWSFN